LRLQGVVVRRIRCALALGVLASAGWTAGFASPTSASTTPALSWRSCDGKYRCSTLPVPLIPSDPSGPTIKLALIELVSTSPHPVGDLVMNPGGPGGSGIQFLEGASFPAALRASFTLVSFDPRGVGESDPVDCVDAAQTRQLIALDPAPRTAGQIAQVTTASKTFNDACLAHTSKSLLGHVSTVDTAYDLDRIRAALGQSKLDYMGFSYGTYLGELYAQMFPTHVRALVLDGVVDPALSLTQSDEEQAEGFETDLRDFFAWCPTNAACHRELPHGAEKAYHELFADIAAGRQIVAQLQPKYGGTQQITEGVAVTAVIGSLYSSQSWTYLAQGLQQGLQGNGDTLISLAYSYDGLMANGQFSNEAAAESAIGCTDETYPKGAAFYEKLASTLSRVAPDFGASEAWSSYGCALWPISADGDYGPVHAPHSPEILVVGSTDDPATPYRWAQAMASELDHARLLTRIGPGHTAYFFSSCIQGDVDRYLTTLTLPAPGTRCPTTN